MLKSIEVLSTKVLRAGDSGQDYQTLLTHLIKDRWGSEVRVYACVRVGKKGRGGRGERSLPAGVGVGMGVGVGVKWFIIHCSHVLFSCLLPFQILLFSPPCN